jgi:hypothetical protein
VAKQTKKFKPTVWTAKFVRRSAIFEGLGALWNAFTSTDVHDITWGSDSTDHTLIEASVLIDAFETHNIDPAGAAQATMDKQQTTLMHRLRALPHSVLIDMEH